MLPLPHINESSKQIEYAFDMLNVDGVGIITNYGDKWLGYSYFDPIWQELNRRKATIYTHPGDANCCANLVQGIPSSAIEWGTDTVRSIANLIFSGSSQKYPDINWIFSHGGGGLVAFSRALPDAASGWSVSRKIHARAGPSSAQSLPLRHSPGCELGGAQRTRPTRPGVTDRLWHGLPLPDGR